jgi:hypothetical protein
MSNTIRLGEEVETDFSDRSTALETREYKYPELQFERPSPPPQESFSSYMSRRQPEQIGVVISGFGIDTRATPIYAGRRPSRLL